MKLECVYGFVDQKLSDLSDNGARGNLSAHIYGVAMLSALFALKRKLEPEIAVAAALLHDIAAVVNGTYDNHAQLGANMAHVFLTETGDFADKEIKVIVTAIEKHTSPPWDFQQYDAILSEADFMQKYLYDFADISSNTGSNKLKQLFNELGIEWRPE